MLLWLKILGARWPSWLPGFEDALSASLPRTSPSVSWHYSAPTQSHIEEYEEKEKKTPKKPQERENPVGKREPCGKVLNWRFHIFCYIRDLLIFLHYLKIKYKAQVTETVLTIEQILPVSRLFSRQHSYLMFFYIQT